MRLTFSLFLFAHALAHVPRFLVEWRLIHSGPDMPYRRSILAGRVHIGAVGARILGLLWLVAGIGIALSGIYFFRNAAGAWSVGWLAVAFSSVMTMVGWPDTRGGAILNAVAIAFLAWVTVFH